jgi:hypothetical protein
VAIVNRVVNRNSNEGRGMDTWDKSNNRKVRRQVHRARGLSKFSCMVTSMKDRQCNAGEGVMRLRGVVKDYLQAVGSDAFGLLVVIASSCKH